MTALSDISNRYSVIEKMLHEAAFRSRPFHFSLADLESRLFKAGLARVEIKKPVFITALPRAGTTLLLNLCVETTEFVSHTYRDMPFLITPIFWERFSSFFKRPGVSGQRAHGDGITINPDSPEAFEEVIWKGFWPSHYKKDRIIPWSEPSYPPFEKFLVDHLRKIILLRRAGASPEARYVSKNNLNIARIGYLKRIFPDSIIVVPFREPLQHASSLLRQHKNFLKIHGKSPFARKYMEDIGHYDFGENLRPVDFDDRLSSGHAADPDTPSFWLQYWISAYRYLLKNLRDHINFISYDSLCKDPRMNLELFGRILEIKNIRVLTQKADRVIEPKPYPADKRGVSADILNQANALYENLRQNSLR